MPRIRGFGDSGELRGGASNLALEAIKLRKASWQRGHLNSDLKDSYAQGRMFLTEGRACVKPEVRKNRASLTCSVWLQAEAGLGKGEREHLEAGSSEVRAKESGFAPQEQGTHLGFSGRGERREQSFARCQREKTSPTTFV